MMLLSSKSYLIGLKVNQYNQFLQLHITKITQLAPAITKLQPTCSPIPYNEVVGMGEYRDLVITYLFIAAILLSCLMWLKSMWLLKGRKRERMKCGKLFIWIPSTFFPCSHWHCFYEILIAGVNVTNDVARYTRNTVVVLVYFFHLFSFLLKIASRR